MATLYDRLRDPLIALSLLTRLPLRLPESAFARSAEAAWAYPLVGIFTGVVVAAVGWVFLWLGLPPLVAALLALGASIIVTGAMHEDGLADCADGFWGGWDPDMRLKIMKDSQIGTYGVLALGVTGALRVTALSVILVQPFAFATILAIHVASRSIMPALMTSLEHARTTGLSKSVGTVSAATAVIAGAIGIAALLLAGIGVWAVVLLAALSLIWRAIAKAKIGGQTGDVLGASQQIAEVTLLLFVIAQ